MSARQRRFSTFTNVRGVLTASTAAVVAAICLTILPTSCDNDSVGTDCRSKSISSSLHRTLYWGAAPFGNEEPNTGEPSSTILKPLWYASDHILVVSQRLSHGRNLPGLYDISIDPLSLKFKDYSALLFPYAIQAFDIDSPSQTYLVLYARSPSYANVVTATASSGSLVPETTVVDSTWTPVGARLTGDAQAAVVYCLSPPIGASGFYRFSLTGDSADSLLISDEVGVQEAAGFDVTATSIFYGRTTGNFPYSAELFRYPLTGAASATKIASLPGEFVSVSVNADETCALISRYLEGYNVEPGNRVDVVNLSSGSSHQLDVRTRPCNFVIADFATWHPAGGSFAFSAAGFSGEGDLFPRELWIRTGVPCK